MMGTVTQAHLEAIEFHCRTAISPEFANLEARVVAERLTDMVLADFRLRIMGARGRQYLEQVPATWWDFWKATHPRLVRFLRLTLPNYRTIRVEAASLAPTIKAPKGHHMYLAVLTDSPPRWMP